ncbi:hypothetical protein PAAG_03975 [Paracoccidioides lutzii Pb01]|uniref:Uncharacterized protein n=1 Tax=Paracoccidioides lutzii (strain ATCC MYA-826 / Pb01) TaxID=502779 RepID=C1GZN1_PARBA|nr:hypothetical protein PAAG_03975 [Paracoccidioides lutzii Pb01]EEH42054.1 hypothetical protein PAAG_03975 [Paracoccidioides lutzii Pb01]
MSRCSYWSLPLRPIFHQFHLLLQTFGVLRSQSSPLEAGSQGTKQKPFANPHYLKAFNIELAGSLTPRLRHGKINGSTIGRSRFVLGQIVIERRTHIRAHNHDSMQEYIFCPRMFRRLGRNRQIPQENTHSRIGYDSERRGVDDTMDRRHVYHRRLHT